MLWRPVQGYEGLYEISNTGKVKSIFYGKNPRILKRSKTSTGYYKVELYKNKKRRSLRVHRLVAMAFIPNADNKPNINHIDGNPLNNDVVNLEWCTQRENIIHAYSIGLRETFDISKEELEKLYICQRKSMQEIADIKSTTVTVIQSRVHKYGIEPRSLSEAKVKHHITKEMIINGLKSKTQKQLASEIGCDQSLISHYYKRIREKGRLYAK